jgi:hypothetical protein
LGGRGSGWRRGRSGRERGIGSALALAGVLVLAACGGEDPSSTSADATSGATGSASATGASIATIGRYACGSTFEQAQVPETYVLAQGYCPSDNVYVYLFTSSAERQQWVEVSRSMAAGGIIDTGGDDTASPWAVQGDSKEAVDRVAQNITSGATTTSTT